jgi:probable HAF family extracellular repeat protein
MSVLSPFGMANGFASGINDKGQVVGGVYSTLIKPSYLHAYLYNPPMLSDLGTLPGGSYSGGWAINALGAVVGYSDTGTAINHNRVFRFDSGMMYKLDDFGGQYAEAYGINDNGEIVGDDDVPPDPANPQGRHVFITKGHGTEVWDVNDYLDPAQQWILVYATAINNKGHFVGTGEHQGVGHAFLTIPQD